MSKAKEFKDFNPPLLPEIMEVLQEMNFTTATPVQGAVIPYFLSHKDVNVSACTGSGKTLSFLIPVFQILNSRITSFKGGEVGSIVISPTRELALQTYTIAQQFEKHLPQIHVVLITGGNEVAEDIQQLKSDKVLVVISTPGRMKDIMDRQGEKLVVRNLEVLILDEADVLLDLGHAATISAILTKLPKQRRTGLFSATEAEGVNALCKAGLRNPIKIKIEIKNKDHIQAVPVLLKNYVMVLQSDAKLGFLVNYLLENKDKKIIIFFLTCASVDYFSKVLLTLPPLSSLKIKALHGRMVQKKRLKTMEDFRKPEPGILICTDVAARGIDIPDIDIIIQYAPPQDPTFFIHRVGRTARAGREGQSILLLEPTEQPYINFTKKRGVPLLPYPNEIPMDSLLQKSHEYLDLIKEKACKDREYYEESVTAFVADIRAYRNHDCNFILRFDDVNLSNLAYSYALVKLPRMSELRSKKVEYTEMDIDVNTIPYLDEKREAARLERLKKQEEEFAKKKAQLEKRKNEKRERPKEEEKKKKVGKHERIMEEWDELQEEERLYKLFKKKKISEEEYDKMLFNTSKENKEEEDEDDKLEKCIKEHQMRKNTRKSHKTKNARFRGFNR